jgi:hypothetical protein
LSSFDENFFLSLSSDLNPVLIFIGERRLQGDWLLGVDDLNGLNGLVSDVFTGKIDFVVVSVTVASGASIRGRSGRLFASV